MKQKSVLLLVILLFLWAMLPATQMKVLVELFKWTTGCPYCPSAQLGLQQLYDDPNFHDTVVPAVWYTSGSLSVPEAQARLTWYGGGGVPHAQFGGYVTSVGGGGTSTYTTYVQKYNQVVDDVSPLTIGVDMGLAGSAPDTDSLVVIAQIDVTEAITTTQNKVVIVMTRHEPGEHNFAILKKCADIPFTLTQVGESVTIRQAIAIPSTWDAIPLDQFQAVVAVQSWQNKHVLQAGMNGFSQMTAAIAANVTSGPASLAVQFNSNSLPQTGLTSWQWDLNGDDVIDSEDENPYFVYEQPGTYTVSLTVSDGVEEASVTMPNFITVTPSNNITGNLSGIWSPQFAPYIITGDVTISGTSSLTIQPGTEIRINNNAKINVVGGFIADATDSNPIIFTSDNTWKGFNFSLSNATDNRLVNCQISKSIAGAIYVNQASLRVVGNKIFENTSSATSAAIEAVSATNLEIKNNLIAKNYTTSGAGGIGITNCSDNIIISNNVIANNTGSYAGALSIKQNSLASFSNNTVANNTFESPSGGGHLFGQASILNVENSILTGEGDMFCSVNNSTFNVSYSCLNIAYTGTGNINADPLFVAPTIASGSYFDGVGANWSLQATSPCVDAGNPSTNYNDSPDPVNPSLALWPSMGTLRNDMGAYGGPDGASTVETQDPSITTPAMKSMLSVYPNPFNPTTTISLSIPKEMAGNPVTLSIYNLKGQLVKTLINNQVVKTSSFTWKGMDNNNKSAASGIYFVKLVSGNNVSTKKIALLK